MTFKVTSEKENHLFNRKEVTMQTHSQSSPTYKEVEEFCAKHFNTSEDAVKVKTLKGKFGSKDFVANVNIYKSKHEKDKIERKSKKEIEAEKKAQAEVKTE
jgi:ribosomal protein S24E